MVPLNRDAVGKVARALATLNGTTTTLDVKLALRKIGFYATQDEVRYFMLDITSKDGDLVYTDNVNTGFRTYSFRTPVLPVQNVTTPTPKVVAASVNASKVLINTFPTPAPAVLHRDDIPANYVVEDRFGGFSRMYVNVSRSEAKAQWSKDTGLVYARARTKKQ